MTKPAVKEPPIVVINLTPEDFPEETVVDIGARDPFTGAPQIRKPSKESRRLAVTRRQIKSKGMGIVHLIRRGIF